MIDSLLDLATGRRAILAVVVFAFGSTALFGLSPYSAVREASGDRTLPEEGLTNPVQFHEFLSDIGPMAARHPRRNLGGWSAIPCHIHVYAEG